MVAYAAGRVLVAKGEVARVDTFPVGAGLVALTVVVEPASGDTCAVRALGAVLAVVGGEAGRAAEAIL